MTSFFGTETMCLSAFWNALNSRVVVSIASSMMIAHSLNRESAVRHALRERISSLGCPEHFNATRNRHKGLELVIITSRLAAAPAHGLRPFVGELFLLFGGFSFPRPARLLNSFTFACCVSNLKCRHVIGSYPVALPRPCRDSRGGDPGFFADELVVRKALADDRGQYVSEPLAVSLLPRVEPEGLFVQIAEQVKGLDAHVGALDRPLQESPEVLHPIRVDAALDVGFRVVDDAMGVGVSQPVIGVERIGIDARAKLDMGANFRGECLAAHVRDVLDLDAAVAVRAVPFQEPHDGGLVHAASAPDLRGPLRLVHEAGLAADEGLIGFHFPGHLHEAASLQGVPNAMGHEPRALLCDPERPAQFVGADPVLAVDDHPDGGEPLVQPERRVLEDRATFAENCRWSWGSLHFQMR